MLLLYYCLRRFRRAQVGLLLVSSYAFYGYWDYRFLLLLWISTLVDYLVGLGLARSNCEGRRRTLLTLSLVVNLGLLGVFKYFDFFQQSLTALLTQIGLSYHPLLLQVVLPVGISFYTFQTLGYTIDVYRREVEPEKDLPTFALFVAYFPQLVAGPIERARDLLPQLRRAAPLDLPRLTSGFILIVLGLFKKCVLGDLAGFYLVEPAFSAPQGGLHLWVGTLAFAVQIYGDFAGYSDLARGVSRCFGIELSRNFLAPYLALNITDFWRRWHVTLSHWFRDYLYIPLGGNRLGPRRTYFNLVVTMLLCGLWHGAAWNFILWGAYHGVLLLSHRTLRRPSTKSAGPGWDLARGLGCFILVCYGWMVFRIEDPSLIGDYTLLLMQPLDFTGEEYRVAMWLQSLGLLGALTLAVHLPEYHQKDLEELLSDTWLGVVVGLMGCSIALIGSLGRSLPFIYFQF